LIAIATGGRIIPRFEDISPEKLGKAELVQEVAFGTTTDRLTVIRGCASKKSLTILVRGGNSIIVDEAKRAIHDSLCVVRNLVRDSRVVYGGGAPEIAASIAINNAADSISSVEQYAVRAFADALEQIPLALADNSGLWPIEAVADAKAAQIKLNSPRMGIDCFLVGENDMKKNGVYEGLAAKRQQFQLATQVVKMILKIDDVISPSNYM
jgi:T-complex protein 1 subunit epsilon